MLLARHRTFAVLFVLTITLAVGANVVVFSIVNALWLRPQPIDDPDRVVVVLRRTQALDPSRWSDLGLDSLRQSGVFETVSGEVVTRDLFAQLQPRIVIEQVGRPVETVGVTADYFATLGVRISGRDFSSIRTTRPERTPWPSSATICGGGASAAVPTCSARR